MNWLRVALSARKVLAAIKGWVCGIAYSNLVCSWSERGCQWCPSALHLSSSADIRAGA